MVISALNALKRPTGMSYAHIQKYLVENFHIDTNFLNLQIRHIVQFLLERKEITELETARRFKVNQRRKIQYKSPDNESYLIHRMVRRQALDKEPTLQTRQIENNAKNRKQKDLSKKKDRLGETKRRRPSPMTDENAAFDELSIKKQVHKKGAGRKPKKNELSERW